jgi:hypothetical protein
MPPETRWFIKTSLACLLLASILGTLYFGWGALFEGAPPHWLRSLHLHLGTVGWLVNLVLGVGLWMFPMPAGSFSRGVPRYSRGTVIACFVAINSGLAVRAIAEPLGSAPLGLACGVMQTAGIALGVASLWPRIRAITPPPGGVSPGAA